MKNAAAPEIYIGTKIITARPMTRADYNEYRGWDLPADENGDDEGYLVEYTNGSAPNHPNHDGYISWSPAPQFQEAYIRLDADLNGFFQYQPHEQRVIAEEAELSQKVENLSNFIGTETFDALTLTKRHHLKFQLSHMKSYRQILRARIEFFTLK